MIDIFLTIILIVIAIGFFVIAIFQFREKGFLFNNAYIYASKEERNKMNKKPYYRQSAIVFTLLGVVFVLNALEVFFKTDWLFYAIIIVIVITIVYAVVSSIKIK